MQRRILFPTALAIARFQATSAQALDTFIGLANSAAAEISSANAAASAAAASTSAAASTASSSTSAAPAASSTGAAAVGHTGYTSSQLLAIIICSIIFGLLAILLILLALYCCLRSRRRRRNRETTTTTTEDAGFAPATEKRGLFGGLFRHRRNRRSATPVREKRGFRGPTDSDPLRENAPLTDGRHNDLAMTETTAAAPILATTGRPITAEHPAFRNQQNHDNPFTPEPPPSRKAVGSNGHHALRDAAVVGTAYGAHHYNEDSHRRTSGTFRGPTDGAVAPRSRTSFSSGNSPSRHHPLRNEVLVGTATAPSGHRYSSSDENALVSDRPSTSHHGIRDAAILGGGAAAAEGIHHHHRHHSRDRPHNGLRDDAVLAGGASEYDNVPRQSVLTSERGFAHGPAYDRDSIVRPDAEQWQREHHGLRDAALVGGGLAAAEGIHHGSSTPMGTTRSPRHSDPFGSRNELPEDDENNVPLATAGRYNRLYKNVHSNDSYVQQNEESPNRFSRAETTGAPGRDTTTQQAPSHLADAETVGASHTGSLPRNGSPYMAESTAGNVTESSRYPRALNDAAFFAGTANASTHDGQYNQNAISANQRHPSEDAAILGGGIATGGLPQETRDPLRRQHLSSQTNISRYSHGPSESPFSVETTRTTPGYDDQRDYESMPQGSEDAALLAGGAAEGRRRRGNRLSSPFSDTNAVVNQPVRETGARSSPTSRGYTPKHAGRDAAMIGGTGATTEAEPTTDDPGSYSLTSSSSGGLNSHPVRRNRPPTPFGLSSTDSSSVQPDGLSNMLGRPVDAAVFNPSTTHQSQEIFLESGSATSSADHPYSGLGDPPTSTQLDELTHEYPSAELRHSLAGRPESFHAPTHESVDRPHHFDAPLDQRGTYEAEVPMASPPGAFPVTPGNEYQPPAFATGPHDREVRYMRQPSLPRLDERNLRPKPSPLDTTTKPAYPPVVPSRSPNRRSFGLRDSPYDSRRGSATPTASASASGSGSGESWRTSITGQGDRSAGGSVSSMSMPPRPWSTPRSGSPYGRASGIGLASTTDHVGPYNGIGEGYGNRTEVVGGVRGNERAETGGLGRRMRSSDLSEAERERRFGSFGSAL